MKNILLLAVAIVLALPAFSQSSTTPSTTKKKITIVSKSTDESGKKITKAWVVEGEDPKVMLESMGIEPNVGEVIIEDIPEQEKLFVVRAAGSNEVIEGRLDVLDNIEITSSEPVEVIVTGYQDPLDPTEPMEVIVNTTVEQEGEHGDIKRMVVRRIKESRYHEGSLEKKNCIAMGVFANAIHGQKGVRINSLIENGGAQEAGLKAGDYITKIDDFTIDDYGALTLALGHFNHGDKVNVDYIRDGVSNSKTVTLKDWKELPGFEKYSRPDCITETPAEPEIELRDDGIDGPVQTIEALELQNVSVFPNPTADHISLSFSCEPGEVSVQLADMNGKVVFKDKDENGSGVYNRDISLSNLPAGQYLLCVRQGHKVYTHNISKQ